jgi:hypothetical protein
MNNTDVIPWVSRCLCFALEDVFGLFYSMSALSNLEDTSPLADMTYAAGFDGPATTLSVLCLLGPMMAMTLVSNRIYWRWKKLAGLWLDDWCIIASVVGASAAFQSHETDRFNQVFLVAQSAAQLAANNAGYGLSSSKLSQSNIKRALYVRGDFLCTS